AINKPQIPPMEPWYKTVFDLLVGKADAAMLPPPQPVVMSGTAAQAGATAAAGGAVAQANQDAAKALTHQMKRLSGPSIWQGQLQMAQSFLLMGALIQQHLKGEKDDLLTQEKLLEVAKKQGTVPSRVRYQWMEDEETGRLKAVGYHTSMESGRDQVRVRLLKHDFPNNRYEFWEEGATGPTILWTPDNLGVELPTDTAHGEQPVIPSAVPGFEIPEMDDVSILATPMPDEKDFRDYILVFPENAFPPIYVYLSKKIDTPIWTKTEDLTPVSNAYTHWVKHRKEFSEKNYNNSKEYVNDTHDFVNDPPAGVLIKKRGNGDTLYYHPESNTFAVMNKHGVPKTMFKPKNKILYWEKQ
ncbi:S-type pyocin domain-containing protein, partial [Pectobacterium brasiliense]|uniref:S-type pyocin domain-containing protein n=1 Tax=Pectobacterium brasiliense TaxID=180957 RepID=UPI001F222AF5